MALTLQVLTPEKTLYEGQVVSVHVPGSDGPFEVLKDHAPIVASLANPGVLHFRTMDGQAMKFNLLGGVVEVLANKIILLSPGLQQD
ncbi:MAG: F0F1 ATP synthase subunit epsilon [Cytophagia bacterium]|jgi:F-type H+-transporting ATPase subunit epsilon|nr:F0F1 ATP synthase subunit epsilon [Cytophagia bacterium]